MGVARKYPLEIQVDNPAGITFQSKMNPDSKLKGMINLRWHWVKELQDSEVIKAIKVHTTENRGDLGTKPLSREVIERHMRAMNFIYKDGN